MTGTRIPRHVIERAIMNARRDLLTEHIGFFFVNPGKTHVESGHVNSWGEKNPYVEYCPADNIAKDPRVGSEVAAEWLAHKMLDLKLEPLAMFHSHPSGIAVPSRGDIDFFPVHYVNWGLLWTYTEHRSIWRYNKNGEVTHMNDFGVVIPDVQ